MSSSRTFSILFQLGSYSYCRLLRCACAKPNRQDENRIPCEDTINLCTYEVAGGGNTRCAVKCVAEEVRRKQYFTIRLHCRHITSSERELDWKDSTNAQIHIQSLSKPIIEQGTLYLALPSIL